MARHRLRQIAEKRDQQTGALLTPQQTIAGPWPTGGSMARDHRTIRAETKSGRLKKSPLGVRNVTAAEAKAALDNEPGQPNRRMRVYILGVHQSDPTHIDYKAAAIRRSSVQAEIDRIAAGRDQVYGQRVADEIARISARRGATLDKRTLELIRRRAGRDADDWAQGEMVEAAARFTGFSYRRVVGFTFARG